MNSNKFKQEEKKVLEPQGTRKLGLAQSVVFSRKIGP